MMSRMTHRVSLSTHVCSLLTSCFALFNYFAATYLHSYVPFNILFPNVLTSDPLSSPKIYGCFVPRPRIPSPPYLNYTRHPNVDQK